MGLLNNGEMKLWNEKILNTKILKEEEKKNISDDGIYLIGIHQKESRSINYVGSLSTAYCVGYPLSSSEFHSNNNINLFVKKQEKVITELYGKEVSKIFMNNKVISKTIQFIGRLTRDIWKDKRLIILAEERFPKYIFLFPQYIQDTIEVVNSYEDLIETSKLFWSKNEL